MIRQRGFAIIGQPPGKSSPARGQKHPLAIMLQSAACLSESFLRKDSDNRGMQLAAGGGLSDVAGCFRGKDLGWAFPPERDYRLGEIQSRIDRPLEKQPPRGWTFAEMTVIQICVSGRQP